MGHFVRVLGDLWRAFLRFLAFVRTKTSINAPKHIKFVIICYCYKKGYIVILFHTEICFIRSVMGGLG